VAIRLVIFDLDGTLVDSMLDTTRAINNALRPYCLDNLSPTMVAQTLNVTNSVPKLVQNILKKHCIETNANSIIERYIKYYLSHPTDTANVYPQIPETLDALKGYLKAVVSNKPGHLAERIINKLNLSKYFEIIVGGDNIAERKPSPASIIRILKNFNIRPAETIMVGDSKADIDAGIAAQVRTVAVTYGYGEPDFQREADFVIPKMSCLLRIAKYMV